MKVNQFSKRGAVSWSHCPALPALSERRSGTQWPCEDVRKQLYRCRSCGRQSRENPTPHAYPHARREEILHASARTQESSWPHPHGSQISRTTVSSWIKKVAQLPPLWTTLLAPDPQDPTSTTLELDERMARLCSKKPMTPGCGIALCRKTRQGVAYAVVDRSRQDVPAVVGGDSPGVSPGPLLNLFFEGLCFCHPAGAAHGGRKRDRRNRPCGALE